MSGVWERTILGEFVASFVVLLPIHSKMADNIMHLNLLNAIPPELRDRLDDEYALLLKVKPGEIYTMWPRCWKIIAFNSQDDLVIQACKQYLSHHQCIYSTLLFGLSLCPFYINGGPVISTDVSARYLNSGIRAIQVNGIDLNLDWLLARHRGMWQNICQAYLNHHNAGAIFDENLVKFASDQLGRKAVA